MDGPSPPALLSPRATADGLLWVVILIFLFRAFAGEPFTIPTASMSPTFLGRHYATTCSVCRHPLQTPATHPSAHCPICNAKLALHEEMLTSGDHVWVLKQPFFSPARHDAVALHSPDDPSRLVIKRIVGLPGEEIRLREGNVECRGPSEDKWSIPFKPAPLVQALASVVFDDALRPQSIQPRWRARGPSEWTYFERGYESTADSRARLRYRHPPELPPLADLVLKATVDPSAHFTSLTLGFETMELAVTITRRSTTCRLGEKELGAIPFFLQPGVRQSLAIAYVDARLYFWVNGEALATYDVPASSSASPLVPFLEVAERGTKVTDLVLRRDINYRQASENRTVAAENNAGAIDPFFGETSPGDVWRLGPDEYFVLGDNPEASLDSRFWRRGPGVARKLIVGKVWRPEMISTTRR